MEDRILTGRHLTLMLVAIAVAAFMDGVDGGIVGIVLPDIGRQLGVDTDTASWATVIYFLVLAALIIPIGRI